MSDYDALTDLFLSDGGPAVRAKSVASLKLAGASAQHSDGAPTPVPAEPMVARPPLVEGLILGHLPVLGAAWVMQYAKHVADEAGEPVALLRLQGGQVSVDVVHCRGSGPGARVGGAENERASLEEGIEAAGRVAGRWLVRVDDTSEPELPSVPGLSSVTLLTGADDAAVVASYRTMKGLCSLSGECDSPALHLAIMGAPDDRAAAAEAKLRRASMTFLGRDIDGSARVPKIGAGSATPYFRGEWVEGIAKAVELIGSGSRPTIPEPSGSVHAVLRRADAGVAVEVKSAPVTPAPEVGVPCEGLGGARATGAGSQVLAGGERANAGDAVRPARPIPAGLTVLDVACPYAPGVQFAMGGQGSLHLVGSASAQCVQELLTAAAWSGEHAALLARAFPVLSTQSLRAGPTLHVLSEDARALRGLLDTAVRVHLVVEVGGTRVVRALNER